MTADISHVLHHADGPPTVPDDMYDTIFEQGKIGDWHWADVKIGNKVYRTLWILVPSLRGFGQGPLQDRGIELIEVYPSHAPNNWAQPGDINGWDGNVDSPTLRPSIFVGGESANPGWHGFFKSGKLQTV